MITLYYVYVYMHNTICMEFRSFLIHCPLLCVHVREVMRYSVHSRQHQKINNNYFFYLISSFDSRSHCVCIDKDVEDPCFCDHIIFFSHPCRSAALLSLCCWPPKNLSRSYRLESGCKRLPVIDILFQLVLQFPSLT